MNIQQDVVISVIVTIHNAERYLKECLDSVCAQTFRKIEILCIDGGSTDRSPAILKEYQTIDSRLRIINDPNTSYGHKVNVGIEQARGEYLSVLESDDMYEPYMLERLYEVADKYHPDFVNGEYRCFFDMNGERFFVPHKLYKKQPYNCLIKNSLNPENMEIMDRFWTGIFRKEFLKSQGIKLNESPGASFQDISFRFLTSILADTVYHIELPVYQYRMDNPGSSMKDPSKTVVIADEHDFLQRELRKRKITDKEIWKLRYYWKYADFHGHLYRLQGAGREALFQRYLYELHNDIEEKREYIDDNNPYMTRSILTNQEQFCDLIEKEFQAFIAWNERMHIMYQKLNRAEKIVIFGCGRRGRSVINYLYSVRDRICCFVDNAKELWGTEIMGYSICSPYEAVCQYASALYIIANKYHANDICLQLEEMGIEKKQIHIL